MTWSPAYTSPWEASFPLFSSEVSLLLETEGLLIPRVVAGIVASLESMSPGLKVFSQLLPCTLPCQAMRDIMSRGWSVDAISVQAGFLASLVWGLVFVVIACAAIKIRIR